jgi:hypothetical protein
MKIRLVILLLFSSNIGKSQTDKIQLITIEPYMIVTNGAFYKELCLKSNDSDAEFIQGFNFEWGYSYKLRIKVHKLKNPPEDGSETDYILATTVSKTKVPDNYQFRMLLDTKVYPDLDTTTWSNIKPVNDSTYNYFDKIDIEIPSSLKNEFKKTMTEEQERYGNFVFISPTKVKLIKLD